MRVNDKKIGKKVDVFDPKCINRHCYWPRSNPGIFTQGQGYSRGSDDYLCGTREVHGCPDDKDHKTEEIT